MPDWRRIVQNRLADAGLEGPIESEISDEFAFHLEHRYAELTATGMPERDARSAVLDEIDGRDWIEAARRLCRARPAAVVIGEPCRKRAIMSVLLHDLKAAWRA